MTPRVSRADDPKENPEGVGLSDPDCGLLAAREVLPGAPRGSVMTGIAAGQSSCSVGFPTTRYEEMVLCYGVITLHST